MPVHRPGVFSGVLAIVLFLPGSLRAAQSGSPSASDIKAAYLYQFGQYIESPARPSTFTVCVAGDDAVAAALEKLARGDESSGKTVVRRDTAPALSAGGCGILFVGRDEPRATDLMKTLGGSATLVVGEDSRFLRAGGMVAFVQQDRKVRFSINLATTQAAHLKLSSELLKHAAEVIQ
jgi:hypothetical protein